MFKYFVIVSIILISLGVLCLILELNLPRFKVDLSVEAKKNYRPNMAGEYAVYRRIGLKWVELSTFADIDFAKMEAMRLRDRFRTPYYY